MSGVWQLIDRRLRSQMCQNPQQGMVGFPVFQFAVMFILRTAYLGNLPFDAASQFSTLMMFNGFAVLSMAGEVLSSTPDDSDTRSFLKLAGIGRWGLLTTNIVPNLMQLLRMLVIEIPIGILLQTFGLSLSGMLTALGLLVPIGFLALCYGAFLGAVVTRSKRRSSLLDLVLRGFLVILVLVGPMTLWRVSFLYPSHPLLSIIYGPLSALTSRDSAQAFADLLQGSHTRIQLGVFGIYCVAMGLLILGMTVGIQRLLDGDFLEWRILNWRQRWQITRRPSQRVWDQALEWKEFQIAGGGRKHVWRKGILYLVLALVVMTLGWLWPDAIVFQRVFAFLLMIIPLFETATLASQIVGVEIQEKTLGSLLLLPKTPRQILHEKIRGAGLALVPTLGLSLAIVLWLWWHRTEFIDPNEFTAFEILLTSLAFGVQYLLYLHIVVAASLDSRPRDAIMMSLVFQASVTVIFIGVPTTLFAIWQRPDDRVVWFLVQIFLIVEGGTAAYFMNRGIPSVVREKVQSLEENPEPMTR